jgi:hypothetical protein
MRLTAPCEPQSPRPVALGSGSVPTSKALSQYGDLLHPVKAKGYLFTLLA